MGGALTINTAMTLANDLDNSAGAVQGVAGTFNLAGGSATITPGIILGNHASTGTGLATASLNLTGGTLTMGAAGDIREGTAGSGTITSTLTLNGATLNMNGRSIGLAGALIDNLNFQSGTLQNVAEINNGAGLTKTTGGTLILSGTNTYNGLTDVTAGTLLVNNATGSGTGTGAVDVAANAFLGGTGTIAPTVANGINVTGVLVPGGNVIGNFTLDLTSTTGTVAMIATSGFNFNLGTAAADLASVGLGNGDRLTLSGASASDFAFNSNTIDLLGTGGIGFYKLFDTSLDDASTWTGLTFDGTTGEISSGLSLTNLSDGLTGSLLVGTATNGGTTGDIFLQVVAIPEPSTALLGAFGMLALLRRRR